MRIVEIIRWNTSIPGGLTQSRIGVLAPGYLHDLQGIMQARYDMRVAENTAASAGAGKTPVIGKTPDLDNYAFGPNEFKVSDLLPNQGSPQANWKQNSGVLRSIMNEGNPIKDVSSNPLPSGVPPGFLGAERNLLVNHRWTYNNGLWFPPQ